MNNPFRGCSNLEKIVFEEGHPFYNECNAIIVNNKLISGCNNTIVPEEVKIIGPYAFSGLETMVSIDINKATTINEGAFKGSNNIHSLVCRSSFPPHIAHSEYIDELYWNDVFDESMKNATLYVNDFCIEKYKKDKIWNQFKEIVPIEKVTDFNLTYYVDGEVYKTAQYKYDDEITPLEDPIKEGHTFSGWSEIPERMPGRDVKRPPEEKKNAIEKTSSFPIGCFAIFKGFRACSCIAINCRECLCFMMRLFIQKGTYTLRPMNGNSVIKKKIAPIFLFI